MRGHPLLGLEHHIHPRLEVIETEGRPVAPGTRLILERPRKCCREERPVLADVLPDCGLEVPTSQLVADCSEKVLVAKTHADG